MNNRRYLAALAASGLAAAGMATMAMSSPAVAAPIGPRPVSNWLRAIDAGTPTWVNIGWQTGRRICDVQVRVNGGRLVDVDYPGHRPFTSLSRGNSLAAHRSDYSAVRVQANTNRAGVATVLTTIRYDGCGWHARTQTRSFRLALPVRPDRHNGHGGNGSGNGGGHGQGGQPGGGDGQGGNGQGGNDNPHPRPTWNRPTTAPPTMPTTPPTTTPATLPTTPPATLPTTPPATVPTTPPPTMPTTPPATMPTDHPATHPMHTRGSDANQ